jgi:hypothetical protein
MKAQGNFLGKYRGTSHRLKSFDYGSCAFYFITICTKSRVPYFGEIAYQNDEHLAIPGMSEIYCMYRSTPVGAWACQNDYVNLPPIVGARNCAHLQLGNADLGNERLVNAESGNAELGNERLVNAESGNAELCNEQFGNEKQLGNVEPSESISSWIKNTEIKRPRKKMILTEIGKIAYDFWQSITNHYPFVVLHEFVIMPDHMHGIIQITQKQHEGWKPNEFGNQSKNIPAIIRAYKASVTRYANEQHISFQWQARYFDALLRHEKQLRKTRNYIKKNIAMWKVVR